jgi:hypothetical protein
MAKLVTIQYRAYLGDLHVHIDLDDGHSNENAPRQMLDGLPAG